MLPDVRRWLLAATRHPIARRRQLGAQDELAVDTARLETAVRVGDFVERDALGDARLDGVIRQHCEQPFQIFAEPRGVSCAHQIDRVDVGTLAFRQAHRQALQVLSPKPRQNLERTTLRLHAGGVAKCAEQTAALERRPGAPEASFTDAVEHDVEATG